MTPQQKQKIREEFYSKIAEFCKDGGIVDPYPMQNIADYFLSILDKELEEERTKLSGEIKKVLDLYKVNDFSLDAEIARHILALIHNKS